jgi:hypothetical protein
MHHEKVLTLAPGAISGSRCVYRLKLPIAKKQLCMEWIGLIDFIDHGCVQVGISEFRVPSFRVEMRRDTCGLSAQQNRRPHSLTTFRGR